jgi:hypothetical protein
MRSRRLDQLELGRRRIHGRTSQKALVTPQKKESMRNALPFDHRSAYAGFIRI